MPELDDRRTEERRIRVAYAGRRCDDRYGWSSPAYVFMMHEVERRLLELLSRNGLSSLDGRSILEIGCGTGHWLREFVKWGARPRDVVGMDLLADRVDAAKARCAPGVRLFTGSAASLPLPDARFDVVAQFTVFTSILDPDLKRRVAAEMRRVAKPDGLMLWYDFSFDNPGNPDVRGIRATEIRKLFPGCSVTLRRVTLAPPVTRRVAPRSWLVCTLLDAIPLLRTHYLGLIRKREDDRQW